MMKVARTINPDWQLVEEKEPANGQTVLISDGTSCDLVKCCRESYGVEWEPLHVSGYEWDYLLVPRWWAPIEIQAPQQVKGTVVDA